MMKKSLMISAILAMMLTIGSTASWGADLQQAIELHDAAWKGEGSTLEPALELLQELHSEQPDNPHVLAYLGSVYAISARDSWNILTKSRHGNKGLEFLDQAMAIASNDKVVRLLRARVHLAMPAFLGRRDEALDDLIALDRIFRANPTAEFAEEMIEFYRILADEAPDKGDWSVGEAIAQELVG